MQSTSFTASRSKGLDFAVDLKAYLAGMRPNRISEVAGRTTRDALDDGLRLTFDPAAPVERIAQLAAAEQGCCRFFDFVITIDGRGTALEVRAPDAAQDILADLFGAAA